MPHRISLGHHWQGEPEESLKGNAMRDVGMWVLEVMIFGKHADINVFVCEMVAKI